MMLNPAHASTGLSAWWAARPAPQGEREHILHPPEQLGKVVAMQYMSGSPMWVTTCQDSAHRSLGSTERLCAPGVETQLN